MKLKSLQNEFQDFLLDRSGEILSQVHGNSRADTKVMMKVYHYAYKARLVGCLATDFPSLFAYMGREEFTKMAHLYIGAHPSATPSVRWLGRHLSDFLKKIAPYKHSIILTDLACFEWGIAQSFDAKDAPYASMADMAIVPPESWPGLRLVFHPTSHSLALATQAPMLREMIINEENVTDFDPSSGNISHWWIWRHELEVKYHHAAVEEEAVFTLMQSGGDFATMCEILIPFVGEERAAYRAAEILRAWLEWGMVTDLKYETLSSLA